MARRITQWLFYSLALTPLLVWKGLFYEYTTMEAFFIMGVAELLLLCFVWVMYRDPDVRLSVGPIGKGLSGFVAILLLASFFGVDPTLSFWSSFDRLTGVILWLHLLVLFFVGRAVLRTSKDWRGFFLCSTAIGFLVAISHLLSFTSLEGAWFIERDASIANSTFFAVYLLFQLLFCVPLFVSGTRNVKLYSVAVGAMLAMAIVTSEAQAVILSLLGGLVLSVAILGIVRTGVARIAGFFVLIALSVIFTMSLISLSQPSSAIRQRFVESSSGARFALWDIAWKGIVDKPLLGWGPENFESVFWNYYNPCFGSLECGGENYYNRAHSKPLDVLIEVGAIGGAAYLAIFAVAVWSLWRCRRKSEEATIPAALTGGLMAYFVQNLVGLDMPLTLLFWVLSLAYLESVGDVPREMTAPRRPIPVSLAFGITLCLPVLFFFVIVQPLRANASVAQWFLASSESDRLSALDRATGLSSVGKDQRLAFMARQVIGGIWIAKIRGELLGRREQVELDLIRHRLATSLEKNPRSLPLALNLALASHTQAKFFDASYAFTERILSSTIEHLPTHQAPRWALAAVYVEQDRIEEALAMVQEALDLDPTVVEAHIQRLIIAKFVDDEALFLKYADESLEFYLGLESEVRFIYETDLARKRDQLLFELY